ncbi:hypothetical protein [Burkholderia aenigmatica]|uniref:hypothetical protein n=1 Tax=Burkholderia aenigmatica TaxID=2015348 RepID=UPI0026554D32|nr:hypothetical protein [Burkholderia aenigmatica]MDN7880100.1 hypothetical protein [Burkholderia aenigmatica]
MTAATSISINEIKSGDQFASAPSNGAVATGGTITKIGPVNIEFALSCVGQSQVAGACLPKANLVGGCILREGKLFEVIE